MELGRAVLRRLLGIDDHVPRLVVHRNVLKGVLGLVAGLGDNHCDRVPDVAHLVHGDGGMRRSLQVGVGYEPGAGNAVQRALRVRSRVDCKTPGWSTAPLVSMDLIAAWA